MELTVNNHPLRREFLNMPVDAHTLSEAARVEAVLEYLTDPLVTSQVDVLTAANLLIDAQQDSGQPNPRVEAAAYLALTLLALQANESFEVLKALADAASEEAMRAATRDPHNAKLLAYARCVMAEVLIRYHRLDQARTALDQARAIATWTEDATEQARMELTAGRLSLVIGDLSTVVTSFHMALKWLNGAEGHGGSYLWLRALTHCAFGRYIAGNPAQNDEARPMLWRVREQAAAFGMYPQLPVAEVLTLLESRLTETQPLAVLPEAAVPVKDRLLAAV